MLKYRFEVISADLRGLHLLGIVEAGMQLSCMNQTPSIAQSIGILGVNPEASFRMPLDGRNRVGSLLQQEVNGLAP